MQIQIAAAQKHRTTAKHSGHFVFRPKACKENTALALGLNIVEGKIVYKAVADVFGLKYDPISL